MVLLLAWEVLGTTRAAPPHATPAAKHESEPQPALERQPVVETRPRARAGKAAAAAPSKARGGMSMSQPAVSKTLEGSSSI
jgi:hypothetical protein